VNRSVNIGVMVFVETGNGRYYLTGLLGSCSIIKVNKRIIVYFPRKNWKIISNPIGIQNYFSASVFILFESVFANSSSSRACFSSKVDSLGIQSGMALLFS